MRVIAAPDAVGRSVKTVATETKGKYRSRAGNARSGAKRDQKAAKRGALLSDEGLAAFLTNTATLLNSGVPLIKALEAVLEDDVIVGCRVAREAR